MRTRPTTAQTGQVQSKVGLARIYGERLGHLSRHRQTQLLHSEVEALRSAAQKGIDGFAFRKAFIGAGGYERDWDRLVAPVVRGVASRRSAPVRQIAFDAPDDPPPAPVAAVPAQPVQECGPAVNADGDPLAGYASERLQASSGCELIVCEVSEQALGVRVKGVFGGGEHGGSQVVERVRQGIDAGVQAVLVDLSGVSALRLDAVGPLVSCQVSVHKVQGRMALVVPDGAAGGLLEASGLTERMRCFGDAAEALAYLATG